MEFIIKYFLDAFKSVTSIFVIGILPYLFFAMLMQFLSNCFRKQLASIFGEKFFIYATAPGTVLHELSHALFCLIFCHKIVEIKVFAPKGNCLGYVKHSYNSKSLYQKIGNFFIGTGPIWIGTIMLCLISIWFLPANMHVSGTNLFTDFANFCDGFFSIKFWTSWQRYLWLYLVLTISAHITLSSSDINGAKDGFLFLIIALLLFQFLFNWVSGLNEFVFAFLQSLFLSVVPILIFELILFSIVILFLKVFSKR